MNELIKQVEKWSIDKGLHNAESSKQFVKVVEETGEIARALIRNDREGLCDGIGDVVVTLIILAQQNDMTLHECLEAAYSEIKSRTGITMNGIFVKTADLSHTPEFIKLAKLKGVPDCIELTDHYNEGKIQFFIEQIKRIESIEDGRDLFQLSHGVITTDREQIHVKEDKETIIKILKESRIPDMLRGRL